MAPEKDKSALFVPLEGGFTAESCWQHNQNPPYWGFGFLVDETEMYQPCLCASSKDDPWEAIFQGIETYELPLPLNPGDLKRFRDWQATVKHDAQRKTPSPVRFHDYLP